MILNNVSTHSRPKAAGATVCHLTRTKMFQHTAARRRLAGELEKYFHNTAVSTHSRPKAADNPSYNNLRKRLFQHTAARRRLHNRLLFDCRRSVSTHSRPKAAALTFADDVQDVKVSTHSRPKAAGGLRTRHTESCSFNTQPPEGGWLTDKVKRIKSLVSTHSRPKAAG